MKKTPPPKKSTRRAARQPINPMSVLSTFDVVKKRQRKREEQPPLSTDKKPDAKKRLTLEEAVKTLTENSRRLKADMFWNWFKSLPDDKSRAGFRAQVEKANSPDSARDLVRQKIAEDLGKKRKPTKKGKKHE